MCIKVVWKDLKPHSPKEAQRPGASGRRGGRGVTGRFQRHEVTLKLNPA